MTGAVGPYVPGIAATGAAEVAAGKGNRLTLAHLRVLVGACDDARLADDAVLSCTQSIGGKLTGLRVEGGRLPDANEPLTPQ